MRREKELAERRKNDPALNQTQVGIKMEQNVVVKKFHKKRMINVYFSICFVSKKTINTYLKLEIRVACREFLAFKYVVIVFSKQNI